LRAKGFSLKENIQHFKTWNFLFFLFLWIIFALLDPDPESESGIRIRNPNPESGIRIRIRNLNPESESGIRIRNPNPESESDPESRIRIRIQIHWSDWIWIRNTVFLGGIIILAQIIEKNAVVKWENLVKKSKWRLISSQC
jgi:hypothetical protein